MAILRGGALHGKVGNLVYYVRNGKPCVRAMPKPTPKEPTVAQLAQRLRMKLATQFLGPLGPMLENTFRPFDRKRMSGLNHATRHTLANAIGGDYPDLYIQAEQVLVSSGALPKLREPELALTGDCQLTLTWAPAHTTFIDNDDVVFLLVYNPTNRMVVLSPEDSCRGSGQLTLEVGQDVFNEGAYCYGFLRDRLRRKVADSVFLGEIRNGVLEGRGST